MPKSVGKWFTKPPVVLGTDGFGRTDSRAALRRLFEVDANTIAFAALRSLTDEKKIEMKFVQQAMKELRIHSDKPNPLYA